MAKLNKKLLFFVTEDWFFCSHFLDRAVAARAAGYEVVVATQCHRHGERIAACGLRLAPLRMRRKSMNPFGELRLIGDLCRLYRQEKPDIVHHVAVKPIVYGTLAAKIVGVPAIVNAPVGMGYVFSSTHWRAWLLRPLLLLAYRWLMNPPHGVTIFENPDDLGYFADLGIVDRARSFLIRGAGVDTRCFVPAPEPQGPPLVVLAARMLWDKGVGEFVEAARLLRKQGIQGRFALVGAPDTGNPAAIRPGQLEAWRDEGDVEWWGHRDDMPAVFAQAHIVCLPSYREGLPKVLIEAAAAGKPLVATDVPGCREVVRHGENGMLVPARDAPALAEALAWLLDKPSLRQQMGAQGRKLAEEEFSVESVIAATLAVYRKLLRKAG